MLAFAHASRSWNLRQQYWLVGFQAVAPHDLMAPPPPSRVLIERTIKNEAGAEQELFDTWLPIILGWCSRLGGPNVDPEEAAHDVFLIVLRRLGELRSPEAFPAWVKSITRKVLAQHRRKAWFRRRSAEEVSPNLADERATPERAAQRSETCRRVQSILDGLSLKHREVLVLCDIEERTAPEVAELLGIPVGTVSSRLRHARQKFYQMAKRAQLTPDSDVSRGGQLP